MAYQNVFRLIRSSQRGAWLVIALALAACQLAPGGTPAAKTAERTGLASPAPRAAAIAPSKGEPLLAPKGVSRVLGGTIAIDASYVVASGGGNVVKLNGQSVVVNNGQVISNDGGTLITNDGGTLLARSAGNVISNDGGTLITNDGGSLITNDGGSLITNDGGTLFADDGTSFLAAGGGIIAQGGGNLAAADGSHIVAAGGGNLAAAKTFKLAAAGLPTPPAVGTRLPAAGVLVSVVSLTTHKYLPLGVDAHGKAVYAVYSNAKGQYTLYLTAQDTSNVVVVASAPGTSDHRRAYNLLAAPKDDRSQTLDESSSVACKFFRRALVGQMLTFNQDPEGGASRHCNEPVQERLLKELLGSFLADVTAAVRAADSAPVGPTDGDARAQRAADFLFGRLSLADLRTQPLLGQALLPKAKSLQEESVVGALADVLQQITQTAARQLAKDPDFFTCGNGSQALQALCDALQRQNLAPGHHGQVPALAARTPAEFGEYVLGTLLSQPTGGFAEDAPKLLEFAQLPDADTQVARVAAAAYGVQFALIDRFKNGDTEHSAAEIQKAFLDLVSNGQPRQPSLPAPTPATNCPATQAP
jgi:hypothetical protein